MLQGEVKAIEKELYREEALDESEVRVIKPPKKKLVSNVLEMSHNVFTMSSNVLAMSHNLFFQCTEVEEEKDEDWVPRPEDEEDNEEYYEEEDKGEAEEELMALEDQDLNDEAEEEAVKEVGRDVVTLQEHIVQMDEAGEIVAAALKAPPPPPVEGQAMPPIEGQEEAANVGEGVQPVKPQQEPSEEMEKDATEVKVCLQWACNVLTMYLQCNAIFLKKILLFSRKGSK